MGSESLSEQGGLHGGQRMDASFISACTRFPVDGAQARAQRRLAHFQRQHRNICEVQFSAMHSSMREGSKERILSTLRGTTSLLTQLNHTIRSEQHMGPFGLGPLAAPQNPARPEVSPPRPFLEPLPSIPPRFDFRQTSLHEIVQDADPVPRQQPQPERPLSHPEVILEVPTVTSVNTPRSPKKQHSFDSPPLDLTKSVLCRPVFPDACHPDLVRSFQQPRAVMTHSSWEGIKSPREVPRTADSIYPLGRLAQSVQLDPAQRAACEQISRLLRFEVFQNSNSELCQLIRGMQRRC